MASKLSKPSLIKAVASRGYGAAAATQQAAPFILPAQEPKVTTLPSGVVVASLENNAPVSRVALFFKAGSRYETAKNAGACHMVRSCVGLATEGMTAFSITRKTQQAGAALAAQCGRDHIMYSMEVMRDNLDNGLEVLGEVGLKQAFKAWEVTGNMDRVKRDLALRDPSTLALELLHKAAYRNTGLGNSIFIPEHKVGKLSPEVLADFVAGTHLAGRMAVVGLGVDHGDLVAYAGGLGAASGDGVTSPAAYGSGEIRQENGAAVTLVAVAGPGASIGSSEAASLAVAQQILGVGPCTKYGSNSGSLLAKAVESSGGIGVASSININYSDAGLFGYFIAADSGSVDKVVRAVHSAVAGLSVTDAEVAKGKNRLKAAILMASECGAEGVEDMGLQALLKGQYTSPAAAAAAVDAVTTASVEAALKKVRASKASMGAVGSVSSLPYLDQL